MQDTNVRVYFLRMYCTYVNRTEVTYVGDGFAAFSGQERRRHFSFCDAGMQDNKCNSPTMSSQATAFAQKEAAATTVAFCVEFFVIVLFALHLLFICCLFMASSLLVVAKLNHEGSWVEDDRCAC